MALACSGVLWRPAGFADRLQSLPVICYSLKPSITF